MLYCKTLLNGLRGGGGVNGVYGLSLSGRSDGTASKKKFATFFFERFAKSDGLLYIVSCGGLLHLGVTVESLFLGFSRGHNLPFSE